MNRPNYAAMTTNERLATAGLLDAFDHAIATSDRDKLIKIFEAVDFEHDAAVMLTNKVLEPEMRR